MATPEKIMAKHQTFIAKQEELRVQHELLNNLGNKGITIKDSHEDLTK